MFRTLLLAGALAVPAAASALPATAHAQTAAEPATLSLSATGEVRIAPDLAVISAGAVTRGRSAAEALSANSSVMNDVFAALDDLGIAERDRQTANLSVQPVYSDRRQQDGGEREIVAYEARNTVSARVRDLDRLGAAIDALVEGGANQLQGIEFAAEDPGEARNEARRRAISELMALKDLYAEAAGFEIVALHSMSESGGGRQPRPVMRAASVEMAPTPVAAGELTISVTVQAEWRIED